MVGGRCVEEFFLFWGPSSSATVRVVAVHDIKEEEGERQQEVQEDKGNRKVRYMEKSERESLDVRMRHGDDDETNKAQT